jgi:hypothetical protein
MQLVIISYRCNSLKHEVRLSNIQFNSSFKEKKTSRLILFRNENALYYKDHMKLINSLCELNAVIFNVKVSGTYSNYCTLRD